MEKKTEVVHFKKYDFDVYIGRPSPWGNPFSCKDDSIAEVKVNTRGESIDAHWKWLIGEDYTDIEQERRQWILDHIEELRGKTLGCWCDRVRCHGDNYIKYLYPEPEKPKEPVINKLF